jgi:hypothetical protein
MKETAEELVRRLHAEEVARVYRERAAFPPTENPGIPHTELWEANPESPLFEEWNTYRREVGRLLCEGRQGQFVLIEGEQVIGLYAVEREALDHGYRLFPFQAFLVHQVQEREPLLRCVTLVALSDRPLFF